MLGLQNGPLKIGETHLQLDLSIPNQGTVVNLIIIDSITYIVINLSVTEDVSSVYGYIPYILE